MHNNPLSDLTITLPQELSVSFSFFFPFPLISFFFIYSRLSKSAEVTVDSIAVLKFETLKN